MTAATEEAGVGVPWIVNTPELEAAFRRDWEEHGLTLREMAAMYGFRNVNGVSRTAKRLGLAPRRGGRPRLEARDRESPNVLEGGRWERCPRRRVLVWVEGAA